jgi:hypothetical protein
MEWIESMSRREARPLVISVSLISASVLMLEIGMIRVFSVMFESHYAFLLISMAVLGLGFGGVFVHKRLQKTIGTYPLERLLPISSALMGSSILIMTVLIIKFSIFRHILLSAMLVLIPFCFAGIFLSTVFRLYPKISGRLYAADLIGAATGAVLTIVMLEAGAVRLNLVISVLAAIPTVLLLPRTVPVKFNKRVLGLVVAGFIAAIILGSSSTILEPIPFANGAFKEMAHLLNHAEADSEIIDSRWSSFGRTDLVLNKNYPDDMGLFVDGTAGTAMYRFNGDPESLNVSQFSDFSGYFPFKLMPDQEKEKVLIIGAGGGREVLISILGGAKDITAIEANPDLVDIMKKHSDFNGGIYNNYPGVRVLAEEGRKFIRSTTEKFDVIMLSIPVTKTSRSLEGYALTENFLFTTDSISDYLDHLTDNGRLIVVAHADLEILRLVLTSLAALQKQGIPMDTAMNRLYVTGPETFPVFVLKKKPLTLKEAETIHSAIHESGYDSSSSFVPYIEQEKHSLLTTEGVVEHHMLNPALYALSTGEVSRENLIDLFSVSGFDIKAVSDDAPFFYKFEAGLPSTLSILLFFSSVAMIFCWIPKSKTHETVGTTGNVFYFLLLFSLLGIGFMMIEIPLFQNFILFLGQPAYSAAILLFSLLIGAGIGSWTCDVRSTWSPSFRLNVAAIATGLIAIADALFLKQLLGHFLWMPFIIRVMISFFLLMPLGFFMGMLFPTGMKLLQKANLSSIIPKMWAVNGIGSVLGATLSISISISYGFSYAILLGGVTYLFIVVMAVAVRSRTLQIRGGKRFAERKVPGFTPIPVRSSHFENSREPVSL